MKKHRRTPTGSARTALVRLADALASRGIRVTLKTKRGERHKRLVIERDGRRRVVFYQHPSAVNYDLLRGIARCPRELGGGGMSHAEIRALTGYEMPGY